MKILEKIGLGSVQFGMKYGISNTSNKTDENEVGEILKYAGEHAITTIDTAAAYGDAEIVLGKFDLSKFRIITKFMPPKNSGSITNALEESLDRLNAAKIEGYLAHRPAFLMENRKLWAELQTLKIEGKIKKIGFSLNDPAEVQQILKMGMVPDLVQVPYNYFDTRFRESMLELRAKNCEIHTRSTFLQGLFFMNSENLPPHFDAVRTIILNLQEEHQENLNGALLKYVLEQDFVDTVIMGIENLEQLRQNIQSITNAKTMNHVDFRLEEKIISPSLWPMN